MRDPRKGVVYISLGHKEERDFLRHGMCPQCHGFVIEEPSDHGTMYTCPRGQPGTVGCNARYWTDEGEGI